MCSVAAETDLVPARLTTQVVGAELLILPEVESTNDLALRRGGDGAVFVADRQTRGRGRAGRPWASAHGLGLWMSVALRGPSRGVGFASALAVRDALMAWRRPELKWPNDLLYDGKKVCGLLVEQRGERIAVGIGVNVRHQPKDFPPEIARRATSLEMAAGGRVERGDVLHAILSELDRRLLQLRAGGFEPIREEWAQGCGILGRRIAAPDAEGVVEDVDPEGALLVKTRDGLRRVMAGELRFPREAE